MRHGARGGRQAREWKHGHARGARKRQAAGAGGTGVQAQARAERAGQGWLGAGQAAWALGARPWPWAVHSVHSTYFRSVLTRFSS